MIASFAAKHTDKIQGLLRAGDNLLILKIKVHLLLFPYPFIPLLP